MADDEDQASKTEDPTPRKLEKLRDDGNVPTSKEVNHLFALVGILLIIGLAGPYALGKMGELFATILSQAGEVDLGDRAAIGYVMSHTAFTALVVLLPPLLVLMVLGYVGGVIQNGPLFSTKPITPKLEKISPIAGFKRLFSLKSLAEFLKSLLKFTVIGTAMVLAIHFYLPTIYRLVISSVGTSLDALRTLLLILVGIALALMLLLATADFIFQKFEFIKQHRMSRKELKDEVKETEGDPYVRQRQRQIRMERAQQRMMSNVPKADVVVTNPTHYAVALRYKPDEGDDAPVVTAKGLDFIALRIREIATQNDIPLYEDPPLARRLYNEVELDQPIPLQLYEVVAKVISFVQDLATRRNRA